MFALHCIFSDFFNDNLCSNVLFFKNKSMYKFSKKNVYLKIFYHKYLHENVFIRYFQ